MKKYITSGGDDLGTIWYDFMGMTLPEVIDWIRIEGFNGYKIVDVIQRKKYLIFGPAKFFVTLNKTSDNKIKSEFMDMLKFLIKRKLSKLEFQSYHDSGEIKVTFTEDIGDAVKRTTELKINLQSFENFGSGTWQEIWGAIMMEHNKASINRFGR